LLCVNVEQANQAGAFVPGRYILLGPILASVTGVYPSGAPFPFYLRHQRYRQISLSKEATMLDSGTLVPDYLNKAKTASKVPTHLPAGAATKKLTRKY